MTVRVQFILKDDIDVPVEAADRQVDRIPEEIVDPIHVDIVQQVTLGRGEDDTRTIVRGHEQSEEEFQRQLSLVTNPHVDLSPFHAHHRGVSRRHARLQLHNLRLTVEDLGSTNGTFVNNEKLEPNMAYNIKQGDELRLGFLSLTFTMTYLDD